MESFSSSIQTNLPGANLQPLVYFLQGWPLPAPILDALIRVVVSGVVPQEQPSCKFLRNFSFPRFLYNLNYLILSYQFFSGHSFHLSQPVPMILIGNSFGIRFLQCPATLIINMKNCHSNSGEIIVPRKKGNEYEYRPLLPISDCLFMLIIGRNKVTLPLLL